MEADPDMTPLPESADKHFKVTFTTMCKDGKRNMPEINEK